MTLHAAQTLIASDRARVRAVCLVSIVMLAVSALARVVGPSPFAPRVNVRWAEGISDARRQEVERTFALVNGQHQDGRTWQYDLIGAKPPAVRAMVENPAVEDTHYIDRATGEVSADAPLGTARLADPGVAGLIRSPLFDWFVSLWIASFVVSSAWLAGGRVPD